MSPLEFYSSFHFFSFFLSFFVLHRLYISFSFIFVSPSISFSFSFSVFNSYTSLFSLSLSLSLSLSPALSSFFCLALNPPCFLYHFPSLSLFVCVLLLLSFSLSLPSPICDSIYRSFLFSLRHSSLYPTSGLF